MYQTGKLSNGIMVVMEKIPYVKSVSFGVWVKSGSAYETPKENGISHFIEHMVFKGTKSRSAAQIAQEMDDIGGQMNAFTAKETTCFYTKTLDSHLETSVQLLCDMLFHSKFTKKDIETEKKVVLEEIHMYEDTPDELVFDLLAETAFRGHPLSQPILGTQASVGAFDTALLRGYMQRHYTADRIVLSVAGNIQFQDTMDLLERTFGREQILPAAETVSQPAVFQSEFKVKRKEIEQIHLCCCFEGLALGDPRSYDLSVVSTILGGAMGSRLFQKIREAKGLVYTVYSCPSSFETSGLFEIYAATNPRSVKKVTALIADELELLRRDKITPEEIHKAKEQIKCSYILGMESTSSRMSSIGKSQLMLGRFRTQEDVLKKIDAVTKESVDRIIDQIIDPQNLAVSAVGMVPKSLDLMQFFETESW